jgi:hypothetical protein
VRHSLRRGIVIDHFINNLNWYNNDFDFVVTEDHGTTLRAIQSTKIIRQFGEPADRFECNDRNGARREVLVYNRPEDRSFQQQYRTHFARQFAAADLPGQIGDIIGTSRSVQEGPAGFLAYGPYIELFLGDYRFELDYESHSPEEEPAGKWDVLFHPSTTSSPDIIADGLLTGHGSNTITGRFAIREPGEIEIRTFYTGHGSLKVNRLLIKRIG